MNRLHRNGDLVNENEEIKCNNIIKTMINFDDLKRHKQKHNSNQPQIPDHLYRKL